MVYCSMQVINRTNLGQLRVSIQSVLAAVAEEYDVKITVGNANYTGRNATIKIEVATVGDDGEVNTKEAMDFRAYASRYGMVPSDLGRSFRNNGYSWTITGCKPRSPRYPIIAERVDGKRFKFSASLVKGLL